MSADETVVLWLSVALAAVFTYRALVPLALVSGLRPTATTRGVVLGGWAVAMLLVHATLTTIAAWDVRESAIYTGFYDVMGLAWIACSIGVLHRLGLSLRDDVIERRNPAALAAITGATIGLALTYAGGNVGDGPGWWCVVFASGLATLSLFVLWILMHVAANTAETITIERDLPAGLRVGALLAACGLVLGRAAAGDWISASDTAWTFALAAWPVLVLAGLAVGIELALKPGPRALVRGPVAVLPGVVYFVVAAFVAWSQGAPT